MKSAGIPRRQQSQSRPPAKVFEYSICPKSKPSNIKKSTRIPNRLVPAKAFWADDRVWSSARSSNGNPGRSRPCVHQRSPSTHPFGSPIQAMRDAARPGASWHAGQAAAISRATRESRREGRRHKNNRLCVLAGWLTG